MTDLRHRRPGSSLVLPAGACDCHMHVFGALDRYPPSPTRTYTPKEASLAAYDAVATTVGLTRMVVVQPSAYGTDNRCTLDTIAAAGGNARGVVGYDPRLNAAQCADLHARGVRGVRLNFASVGTTDPRTMSADFQRISKAIAPLGWHLQIFTELPRLVAILADIEASPVPVVIDHMALAKATLGVTQSGFRELLRLLESGHCWVKLSGAYRVSSQPGYRDVDPIARALIGANPERVVWGTDWPHTAPHGVHAGTDVPTIEYLEIDETYLVELLADWCGDKATLERVLVRNPATLYGFDA